MLHYIVFTVWVLQPFNKGEMIKKIIQIFPDLTVRVWKPRALWVCTTFVCVFAGCEECEVISSHPLPPAAFPVAPANLWSQTEASLYQIEQNIKGVAPEAWETFFIRNISVATADGTVLCSYIVHFSNSPLLYLVLKACLCLIHLPALNIWHVLWDSSRTNKPFTVKI